MKHWHKKLIFPVTLVSIALGFILSLQISTQRNVSEADRIYQERLENMRIIIANAQSENERLKVENQELIIKLESIQQVESNPIDIRLLDYLLAFSTCRQLPKYKSLACQQTRA